MKWPTVVLILGIGVLLIGFFTLVPTATIESVGGFLFLISFVVFIIWLLR